MLGILRRVFSFQDWNVHHPGEQPPGDMLDASFDAQNQRISELETLVSRVLRSDGALANGIVSFDTMSPAFFRFFQAELDKAVEKLRFELSEQAKNAVRAEKAAVLAADDAKIDLGRAEIVRNALKSAENSAVAAESALFARTETVSALIAKSEDARTDFDDASSEAQAWADVSMAWAENMPDTIPPNLLAVMDVTGDHWSSRWWANYASQIVTAGLGVPGPAGPTGPAGPAGAAGQGVPVGGGTGQVLAKTSAVDYATTWVSPGGVSDGDKGDIVVSGSGAAWLFDSSVVTAAAKTVLDDASVSAMLATLGGLPSASYTAADVLAKIKTVDGTTSGLDADLLDGNDSAFFAPASSVTAGDALALPKAGGTMTGTLGLLAGSTAGPSLNIPTGAAPTTPTDGDLWQLTGQIQYRYAAATYTVITTGHTQVMTGTKSFNAATKFMQGTANPAGGTTGAGITFGTSTNLGVFFGSGAPTLSAFKGSLYLRSDGAGTNTRVYVNTDGTTGWAAMSVIATGTTAPSSPATNDVWIDTT